MSALRCSSHSCHCSKIIDYFLNEEKSVLSDSEILLHSISTDSNIIRNNSLDIIKHLLSRGVNINSTDDRSILTFVVIANDLQLLKDLVPLGLNLSFEPDIINRIIRNNFTEIMKYFLEQGFNCSSYLFKVIIHGNKDMIQLMIDNGASISSDQLSYLETCYVCQEYMHTTSNNITIQAKDIHHNGTYRYIPITTPKVGTHALNIRLYEPFQTKYPDILPWVRSLLIHQESKKKNSISILQKYCVHELYRPEGIKYFESKHRFEQGRTSYQLIL